MRSHLSPLDAALLEIEEADEAAHMQIGWAMVFDPLPSGERPSLERLREQVRRRLPGTSILRRRLSAPRVGRLSLPVWLPDPDLDVGRLIRRASLPAPGGEAELMDWLGGYFSQRLDRSRPLWETILLEGLEGGRWALVSKVHHCLIDGISAANVAAALLDVEPEPDEDWMALGELIAMLGKESKQGVLARLRGAIGEAVSGGIDAAIHPRKVAPLLSQSQTMAEALVRDELAPAPHTSLNGRIGTSRRLGTVEAPLEDVKQVKRELGGTVNDVVLAMTAGGLRRLFEHREEEVGHVRAMVPVSLGKAGEALALGSGVSSLFVDLAIAEPDPLLRYRRIVAAAEELKRGDAVTGAGARVEAASLAPPLIQSVIARLAFTPRLFNVTIKSIPTSPFTVYALGAPMRRAIPLVPIFSGHALSVAVVSYDGRVFFGLNADRDAVPDLDLVRIGIEESLNDLTRVTA